MHTELNLCAGQDAWVLASGRHKTGLFPAKIHTVAYITGPKTEKNIEFVDVELDEYRIRFEPINPEDDNPPLAFAQQKVYEGNNDLTDLPREVYDTDMYLCITAESAQNCLEHLALMKAIGAQKIIEECAMHDLRHFDPYWKTQGMRQLETLRIAYGLRFKEPCDSPVFRDNTIFSDYESLMEADYAYTERPPAIDRIRHLISEAVLRGAAVKIPADIAEKYKHTPTIDLSDEELLTHAEETCSDYMEDYWCSKTDFSASFGLEFVDQMMQDGLVPEMSPEQYETMKAESDNDTLLTLYSNAVDNIISKMDAYFEKNPVSKEAERQYLLSIGIKLK